jgi:hypothetical protein
MRMWGSVATVVRAERALSNVIWTNAPPTVRRSSEIIGATTPSSRRKRGRGFAIGDDSCSRAALEIFVEAGAPGRRAFSL